MSYVIGVDEVGRGSLAGDVYVAGVMVPEDMQRIPGVDDSKKLNPVQRNRMYDTLVHTTDLHYVIATRTVADIDRIGIDRAVGECFLEAIRALVDKGYPTSAAYIDGKPILFMQFQPSIPIEFVIGGDAKNWVIGAASIIAKVTRDKYMDEMAKIHPDFGWAQNKGYGTQGHEAAIRRVGLTPLHRARFCRKFGQKKEIQVFEDNGILDLFKDED